MTKLLLLALCLTELLPAGEVKRPKILGVAHIGIFTKDLEQSRAFYRDFLGFEEPYNLKNPDGSLSMTFFKVNERQYIELFPEKTPDSDRLNHISVETDNAEGMRAYLASKGIKVPEKVAKGRIGNSNFTIKDPEGHGVEIVQYEPGGWTVREQGKFMPESRISHRMMHVGVVVMNLDPEMQFYTDVLGFREIWRGSKSGKTLSWINLKVPDGDDYVEFMLYNNQPSRAEMGTAHHMALEVPDAGKAVETLNARGYRKQYTKPIEIRVGTNRKRQVNLFDPDGTRTELMEPTTVDGKPAPSSTAPVK
jgi:catechol 2,3-dioxygenase-like lactoylglutathione lyase family enzyme